MDRYDIEIDEVLEVNKLVVTYVMLNRESIMISQNSCCDYYKAHEDEEDGAMITLLDSEGKIIADILGVKKIVEEVNSNKVELYIEL